MIYILTIASCAAIGLYGAWIFNGFKEEVQSLIKGIRTLCGELDQNTVDVPTLAGENINEHLYRSWSAYRRQLREDNDGLPSVGDSGIFSQNPAEDYLNISSLMSEKYGLYRWVPSLLVGAGIFCTFIGLSIATVAGLTSLTMSGTSYASLLLSLRRLFEGAGWAFFSSVTGIGASLVFTYFFKRELGALKKEVEKLTEKLNEEFVVIPSYEYSALLLNRIQNSSKEVVSAFSKAISASFRRFDIKFSVTMTEFETSIKESSELLRTSMQETVKKTDEIYSSIQKSTDEFANQVRGLATKIEEGSKAVSSALTKFDECSSRLEKDLKAIDDAHKKWSDELSSRESEFVGGLIKDLKTHEDSLRLILPPIQAETEKLTSQLRQLTDKIDLSAKGICTALSQFDEKSSQTQEDMKTIISTNEKWVRETVENLNKLLESFAKKSEEFQEHKNQFGLLLKDQNKSLRSSTDSLAQIQKQEDQLVLLLKGQNEQLQSSIGTLVRALSELENFRKKQD